MVGSPLALLHTFLLCLQLQLQLLHRGLLGAQSSSQIQQLLLHRSQSGGRRGQEEIMWGEEVTDAKQSEEIGRKKNRENKEEVLQTLRKGNWSLVIWMRLRCLFSLVLYCLKREVIQFNLSGIQSLDVLQKAAIKLCTSRNLPDRPPNTNTQCHCSAAWLHCCHPRGRFCAQPTCSGGWSSHTRSEDRWLSQQTISPCGFAPPRDGGEWRCRNTPAGPPYWFSSQGGAKQNNIKMHVRWFQRISLQVWASFKPQRKNILHFFFQNTT